MKKLFLGLFIFLLSTTLCFSQDVLTKKSGDDILAKVLEVTSTEVKYKKFDNQSGPIFTILKSELLMVRYENGTKDLFNETKKIENIVPMGRDLFREGQADASKYYKGYKGAGTTVMATSLLLSPLVGLIPAALCSTADPKEENLNYPSTDLMKKAEYAEGYNQKAKKIKQGKVWTNWGVAFGINLALVLALTSGN
ncbi:MAG: hypothetical protein HQ449_00150 [Chitinophagaceae bacterium]|nr:hypothetical protein [Chitinophagaceae bacterium]